MAKRTPLGLPEDAAPEEVEARYAELTAFLRSAAVPAGLRSWAEGQLEALDEWYASGDFEERKQAEVARAPTQRKRDKLSRPPVARKVSRDRAESALVISKSPLGWVLAGLVIGALVVAGVAGFFYFRSGGDGTGQGGVPPVSGQVQPLDEARVAELKEILANQPDNQDALFELGERYFNAAQWELAIEWFTKLVTLDPTNTHALTDIGTANFNLRRPQEAKTYWERALQIDPDDLQSHYNLGFYYANVEPVDMEAAVREWETVISLDPNSPQAETARLHIEGLKEQSTPQAPAQESP